MTRPMKERNQAIEDIANQIFDIINPNPETTIRVGKGECLELVERCLKFVETKYGEAYVSRSQE